MTPTTISSLMPSVSIRGARPSSMGEGGGVCSQVAARTAGFGWDDDEGSGESERESCDLLTFLDGGS